MVDQVSASGTPLCLYETKQPEWYNRCRLLREHRLMRSSCQQTAFTVCASRQRWVSLGTPLCFEADGNVRGLVSKVGCLPLRPQLNQMLWTTISEGFKGWDLDGWWNGFTPLGPGSQSELDLGCRRGFSCHSIVSTNKHSGSRIARLHPAWLFGNR
jgi:hypothetical protein